MERVAMMVLCGDRRQLESEDGAMTMAGERYKSCDDNGSLGRSIRCGIIANGRLGGYNSRDRTIG